MCAARHSPAIGAHLQMHMYMLQYMQSSARQCTVQCIGALALALDSHAPVTRLASSFVVSWPEPRAHQSAARNPFPPLATGCAPRRESPLVSSPLLSSACVRVGVGVCVCVRVRRELSQHTSRANLWSCAQCSTVCSVL